MIHVHYVAGMFGSMISHVLESYSLEGKQERFDICPDGSMHSFTKKWHPRTVQHMFELPTDGVNVSTTCYPKIDGDLSEVITAMQHIWSSWPTDKKICVAAPDLHHATVNLLFQYHKIACSEHKKGKHIMHVFWQGANVEDCKKWNAQYTDYSEMHVWELREWFSFFWPKWIENWIVNTQDLPPDFLLIYNKDIMNNIHATVDNIIHHCGLTPSPELSSFLDIYIQKQQYIVEEFDLCKTIVHNTLNGIDFKWAPTNIIAESIIQHWLRQAGYDISCFDLDIFPTDTATLQSLLIRTKDA